MLGAWKLWKIPMIMAGFLFLVVLLWPPFDVSQIPFHAILLSLVILLFLVVVLGLIAFYVGNDSPLPSLSLFVLGLALFVSWLGMLYITLDGWRLTDAVSYDLTSRAGYAERLFLESVMPVVVGLAFVMPALALGKKDLTRTFRAFPLLLVGAATSGLGAFIFSDAYGHYVNPSSGVWGPNPAAATIILREIFQVYVLATVVWIFAGAFLAAIALYSAFSVRHLRSEPSTHGEGQANAKLARANAQNRWSQTLYASEAKGDAVLSEIFELCRRIARLLARAATFTAIILRGRKQKKD